MILQIEKDLPAMALDRLDRFGSAGGKQFLADLEHADLAGQHRRIAIDLVHPVHIKGEDYFMYGFIVCHIIPFSTPYRDHPHLPV